MCLEKDLSFEITYLINSIKSYDYLSFESKIVLDPVLYVFTMFSEQTTQLLQREHATFSAI